jgi:hypothetical protein
MHFNSALSERVNITAYACENVDDYRQALIIEKYIRLQQMHADGIVCFLLQFA